MTTEAQPSALDADALAMARDHLHAIDQLANLDEDRRLKLMASGTSIGHLQRGELEVANTWALVAIAEKLDEIVGALYSGTIVVDVGSSEK